MHQKSQIIETATRNRKNIKMKRKSKKEIHTIAKTIVTNWFGYYGLKDAIRINRSIRKMLKKERERRKEKQE